MSVTVRAAAKINLALMVGPLRADGFHDLATVYQAVSLFDDVTLAAGAPRSGVKVAVIGSEVDGVPTDARNLAVKAAKLVAAMVEAPADVAIDIVKEIPVAGGMAGGSADAAAALMAACEVFGLSYTRTDLERWAADLGSDVPFAVSGGTAMGTGHGEVVVPMLARGELHWVVALANRGLSTPAVFKELDRLRADRDVTQPEVPAALSTALVSGDPVAIGAALHNDLQEAALSLRPSLKRTLDAGLEAGALAGIVSGSGPTTLFLTRDAEHALDLTVTLSGMGVARSVRRVTGPVSGAHIVSDAS